MHTAPVSRQVLSHEGISRVDIVVAQCYMLFSCVVAFICSAWTLNNYMNGSTTMRAYSWIGTVSSALLVAGLLLEWMVHRGCACCNVARTVESARKRGVGISLVHIATSSIAIFSTCVAAVNIYNDATPGLYAISCAILAFNWVYNVMYTPSTTMYLAIYTHVPEADQLLLALQQQSIRYVWRNSRINPAEFM